MYHCRHSLVRRIFFPRFTFQNRMNTVWFWGQKNGAQSKCPGGLTAAWLVYNRVLRHRVPVSWLVSDSDDLPWNHLYPGADCRIRQRGGGLYSYGEPVYCRSVRTAFVIPSPSLMAPSVRSPPSEKSYFPDSRAGKGSRIVTCTSTATGQERRDEFASYTQPQPNVCFPGNTAGGWKRHWIYCRRRKKKCLTTGSAVLIPP